MCGRARCVVSHAGAANVLGVPVTAFQDADKYTPRENCAPGSYTPILYMNKDGKRSLRSMKWGLVPFWTKKDAKPDHWRMFNARSETIGINNVFKRLVDKKRCVVLMNGFYEWLNKEVKNSKKPDKQPYYVHFKGQQHMLMAGLYETWENAEGERLYSYTILTTQSSGSLKWLHNRMPVILTTGTIDKWVDNSVAYNDVLKDIPALFTPHEMSKLSYHESDTAKAIDLEAIKRKAERRTLMGFWGKPKGKSKTKTEKSTSATTPAGGAGGGAGAGAGVGAVGADARSPAGRGRKRERDEVEEESHGDGKASDAVPSASASASTDSKEVNSDDDKKDSSSSSSPHKRQRS